MTLFKGTKKIGLAINKANTIRNQNKTIIANGTYQADSGYTGLGEVTVNVPLKLNHLSLDATQNGTTNAYATDYSLDGFSSVSVNVNIPLQEKVYAIVEADLDSNTLVITPDNGKTAMTKVVIDLHEITRLLSEI